MFPPNVDRFANSNTPMSHAFSIWIDQPNVQVYAEMWDLPNHDVPDFLMHCATLVWLWNNAMERLGLPYRFRGEFTLRRVTSGAGIY
jgi:hypothetical protein